MKPRIYRIAPPDGFTFWFFEVPGHRWAATTFEDACRWARWWFSGGFWGGKF